MRAVELIRIEDKKIIYLDFSGLRTKEEVLQQIGVFGSYIKQQPLNSLITLTNLENMHFNTEIYNSFTNYVKANNPHVNLSAVIGLKGMMNIFYKGFIKLTGRNVMVCNTKEEAINELTKKVVSVI